MKAYKVLSCKPKGGSVFRPLLYLQLLIAFSGHGLLAQESDAKPGQAPSKGWDFSGKRISVSQTRNVKVEIDAAGSSTESESIMKLTTLIDTADKPLQSGAIEAKMSFPEFQITIKKNGKVELSVSRDTDVSSLKFEQKRLATKLQSHYRDEVDIDIFRGPRVVSKQQAELETRKLSIQSFFDLYRPEDKWTVLENLSLGGGLGEIKMTFEYSIGNKNENEASLKARCLSAKLIVGNPFEVQEIDLAVKKEDVSAVFSFQRGVPISFNKEIELEAKDLKFVPVPRAEEEVDWDVTIEKLGINWRLRGNCRIIQ